MVKRPGSTNSKNQPDFKRLKSKVGKRAPKALNSTDTSFKSATVKVRQNVSASEEQAEHYSTQGSCHLISSKGKSLSTLTSQLSHHSPLTRCAALQGIKDSISKHPNACLAIKANLSSLIPALSRCLLDEDDDVRKVTLIILRMTFSSDNESDVEACSPNTVTTKSSPRMCMMAPFLPLHEAYISSALNSLDESIRMNGASATELVASKFPEEMRQHVHALLPAYAGLLASATGRGNASNKSSGGRRKKPKNAKGVVVPKGNESRCNVLKSLISLLRCTALTTALTSDVVDTDTAMKSSDLTVHPRGSSSASNSIVFTQNNTSHPMVPHLPNCTTQQDTLQAPSSSSSFRGKTANRALPYSVQGEILSKLRDAWVEIIQKGQEHGKGVALPLAYLEETSLVITAIQLFFCRYCKNQQPDATLDSKSTNSLEMINKRDKICKGTFLVLLEALPIKDEESFVSFSPTPNSRKKTGNDKNAIYNNVNISLCSLLSQMGSHFNNKNVQQSRNTRGAVLPENEDWVCKVFDYILPCLDVIQDNRSTLNETAPNGSGSNTLISVIDQLLLPELLVSRSHQSKKYLLNDDARLRLLQAFGTSFFPAGNEDNDDALMLDTSPPSLLVGKKIILLVSRLLKEHDIFDCSTNLFAKEMRRIALVLPLQLIAGKSTNESESFHILSSLLDIARKQQSLGVPGDDNISDIKGDVNISKHLTCIQHQIGRIFFANHLEQSLFESYPEEAQRVAIGLVGMIGGISEKVIDAFREILLRGRLSFSIASVITYLVESKI